MFFIGLSISFLGHLVIGDNRELIAVDLLYRHGDRTPMDPYPNDPHKDPSEWPVGWGQLTPIGKMMHFKLGQYLRKRYGDLLPDDYSEKDIYVRSTDVDRTLMSALSDLAGLYPPTKKWNQDLDWQPIPVHTVAEKDDHLMSEHADCPRYAKIAKEFANSEEIKKLKEKYDWVFKYVSKFTGWPITSFRKADYIKDALYIEELYNKTLPEWTKKVYPEPLAEMQTISFRMDTWTPEMKKLRSGPFIYKLVERMESIQKEVRQNKSLSTYKMIMYSGHDTTVANVLDSLHLFDPPIAPPYASCIMMELHHNKDNGKCELRLLFRNQTDREPFLLNYKGCGEFCPLDEFRKRAEKVMVADWKVACELEGGEAWVSALTFISISVTALLLVILIISVIVSFVRRSRRQYLEEYSRFPTEES